MAIIYACCLLKSIKLKRGTNQQLYLTSILHLLLDSQPASSLLFLILHLDFNLAFVNCDLICVLQFLTLPFHISKCINSPISFYIYICDTCPFASLMICWNLSQFYLLGLFVFSLACLERRCVEL